MYALIEKETNKILKLGEEGIDLAPEKPFYWVACPDECHTGWTFNGSVFAPPEAPPETAEQIIARLERALDIHLDVVANSYRYESIRTMVTYATSDHPTFGAEGRAAVKFRDAVYAHGIQAIADVQAGTRTVPTEAELLAELPAFETFLQ